MMRTVKIVSAALMVMVLAVPLCGCGGAPDETGAAESQVATVQRGNLVVDITAAGNLALSRTEDLAFEISGTAQEPLTVEEILVEAGDKVEEGEVIARIATTSLEEAVETAQRTVTTATIDLESATNSLTKLTVPYPFTTFPFFLHDSLEEVRVAQVRISEAQDELALYFEGKDTDMGKAKDKLITAQESLKTAAASMAAGLGEGVIPSEDYWTMRAAQITVEKAQMTLESANDTLAKAEEKLDKAVITAPFAGFITTVNVEGGDEVARGTVAVQLADPNKFEAEIMVSEMDIYQVKLGGDATVQIDALPQLVLPAKVTHISPTATIQSGVVNYTVKVELESLEAVMQERQQARQEAIQRAQQGELPEPLQQAIEAGQITREQAEEMVNQWQQTQAGQGQASTAIPEDFQLREGLTVTVSIIVAEQDNVLLVPNAAVTSQGSRSYVKVVAPDGTVKERAIQTGISNWQYTEVTEGLSEGEQVVVPQGTATTSSTTTSQRPSGGIMIPGMGRPR